MVSGQCEACGNPFTSVEKSQQYCSRACYLNRTRAKARECEGCGVAFARSGGRYCSRACSWAGRRQEHLAPVRACTVCGKDFHPPLRKPEQHFCSSVCYYRRPAQPVVRTCEWCHGEFAGAPSRMGKKFCSHACSTAWQGREKDTFTCQVCSQPFRWSPSRKRAQNPTYCTLKCRNADPEYQAKLLANCAKQATVSRNRLEAFGYKVLSDAGVTYVEQQPLYGKFVVDALLVGELVVVQFDGDYWHGNPAKYPNPTSRQKKCMALDRSQDAYLRACGYEVVRVWESELRTDPNVLLTRLQRVRGQLPLQEAAP